MTLSEFANLGEIFGGLGVVITLIFLILEIKNNARENQIREATDVSLFRGDALKQMAVDDELSRIVWSCLSGKFRMKPHETARFGFYILSWMVGVEVVYIKQLETRFDPKIWKELEESISWWFQFPGMRRWLETHTGGLSQDFMKYLNTVAEGVDIDSRQADVIAMSYREEPGAA